MADLKKCPFCGSEADIWHIFENPDKCMVCCRGCDVVIDGVFPNELEAAKKWNDQVLADEIAALKADRDQWQDGTIIVKLADAEAEIDRLYAALNLAQARAGDYEAEVERLRAENERLRDEAEKNRIRLLQYASLRKYFSALIHAVLGADYYNLGADVYSCDAESCQAIAFKCSRKAGYHFKAARAALEGGQHGPDQT